MTTTINASTSSGLVSTADTSGIIKIQSNGVTTNALAWVNYKGTSTVGIRASYNVSSVTYNSTGDYTINFANTLVDANYAAVVSGGNKSGGYTVGTKESPTASSVSVLNSYPGIAVADATYVYVVIFGN
jgi:hypothetical protein